MSTHCVFSTNGTNLQFQDAAMYRSYREDEEKLQVKYYAMLREKYGVWASNQGKFVASPSELTEWDSHHMENLFKKHHSI